MRVLCIVPLLWFSQAMAQHTITVEVHKVPQSEGKVSVALYDSADTFLKFDAVYAAESTDAIKGTIQVVLKDIPKGTYAIALFYDKNGNDKLDTNWMGIPKEKVAFSEAKMKLFGPPNFKECAFELQQDSTLSISF